MVSHGRDKKDAPSRRKKRRGRGVGDDGVGVDDAAEHAAGTGTTRRDADLPDDFSIFGGSVGGCSSNAPSDGGLDDFGLGEFGDPPDEGEEGADADGDGGAGGHGGGRAEAAATARAARLADALSLASALASERRSARREGGYRALFKAITQYAAGTSGREALELHWESVWDACRSSLQGRGGAKPSEQYVACRVLEACTVVLGEDRDDVVETLDGPLKRVVNATGRAPRVRCAALRALSMAHFVCGTDCLEEGSDASSVLDLCEAAAGDRYRGEEPPPLLRATALDCWSLLATAFHDAWVAAGDDADDADEIGRGLRLLPLLSACLDASEAGLRRSAGECVALIHECRLNLGDEDEAENATERTYRRGSWDGSEWEVLMDE
ncbi:hypothetical protein ACHAWF_015471 [Thalassiosira exigua]